MPREILPYNMQTLADSLDLQGFYREANEIDHALVRLAKNAEYDKEREKGKKEGEKGKPSKENPHKTKTKLYEAWWIGWIEGSNDYKNKEKVDKSFSKKSK